MFGKKKVNGYETYDDNEIKSSSGFKGIVSQTGRGLGIMFNKAKTKLAEPKSKESGKRFLGGLQGMGKAYGDYLNEKPKKGKKKGKNDLFGEFGF